MFMDLNQKTLERIVHNSISNNREFCKLLLGSKFYLGFLNRKYRTEVEIKRVNYSEKSDSYDISFEAIFYDLEDSYHSFDKHGSLTINKLLYTQYNRELTLQEMAITQEDKIRKSLNEYLEFDSDELFRSKFNIVRIFGGAVRDIIAGQDINDVDILCSSKAIRYIETILEKNGYQYMEMLNGKDLQEMYSEIHVINEPHTWIKGKKIVQLIRPSLGFKADDENAYRQGFNDLISNVDLSCCAVSYDGENLYEDYPNAIVHCQSKVFSVNMKAKMYSQKRVHHRKAKLEGRGWVEVKSETNLNRDLKINNVLGLETQLKINRHESVYGC
jgi:hypothetical protein